MIFICNSAAFVEKIEISIDQCHLGADTRQYIKYVSYF